jgi:uncharacterized membrane protein
MRLIIAAVALVTASSAFDGAQAQDRYRWCAQMGQTGSTNCYFVTHKQCREAVAGTGGSCVPNQFYTGPDKPWQNMKKQR